MRHHAMFHKRGMALDWDCKVSRIVAPFRWAGVSALRVCLDKVTYIDRG